MPRNKLKMKPFTKQNLFNLNYLLFRDVKIFKLQIGARQYVSRLQMLPLSFTKMFMIFLHERSSASVHQMCSENKSPSHKMKHTNTFNASICASIICTHEQISVQGVVEIVTMFNTSVLCKKNFHIII